MTSIRKIVLTYTMVVALLLSSFSFAIAKPDEGMFTPDRIASLALRQKGLKIRPIDIYNPNGPDLSDAVIRLGTFCTAEFVSPQGLILTNHHCGFDALVAASSPGKDYGTEGYRAASMKDELPAKDYNLFITNRVEDVTARVRQGTENLTGEALMKALAANAGKLQSEEQAKAANGSTIRIQAVNSGFFYYLYDTTEIKDIRVVYAPPKDIGFFGGDPDNFEWSRHTGDFTYLRAYVAADGRSAEYSPNNVPFKPKKFLNVSIGGLKEGDFVFALGYPGTTTRYRESQAVEYAQNTNYPFLVEYLSAWSRALNMVGEGNEEKRVKLQSEIANIDNARKLYEGNTISLRRSDFLSQRKAEEARLTTWINANAQRRAEYGEVLANLDRLSRDFYKIGARDRVLRTFPNPAHTPIYRQIFDSVAAVRAGKGLTPEKRAEIEATFREREPLIEREMLKFFLKAIADLPADQKFAAAESVFGRIQGRDRRSAEEDFARAIVDSQAFDTPQEIIALYGSTFDALQAKHPLIVRFAVAHADERDSFNARNRAFSSEIDHWRRLFQKGMAEMKGVTPYPDANGTLRFTYGNVAGYQPREAVRYTPFTTLKGVIEKDTGIFPFDVPEKLKDLQTKRDFGRFGAGDSVPVNFLATTDIIGGNSGSPIMNANGELVGIVFDSNFEGLGNDFFYSPDYGRTIAVDIRYVMFVTEKFGDAGWILNEMTITGGARSRAAGH